MELINGIATTCGAGGWLSARLAADNNLSESHNPPVAVSKVFSLHQRLLAHLTVVAAKIEGVG